jgi:hypothetical protein
MFSKTCTHRLRPSGACGGISTGDIIQAEAREISGLDAYLKFSYSTNQVASWNNSSHVAQLH